MGDFLIYGATGYSGTLAAEHAVSRGLRPILAGRSRGLLEPLAARLGVDWRAFPLDDATAVRDGLSGVAAVLHCAGPFSATSRPMADACLELGVHYTDITGEIDVFEALAARDAEAKAAGVMLLPGVGFDVVPSDCLAAHVASRLPDAQRLRISIGGMGGMSRGTAKTMVEGLAHGTRVREGGRIVERRPAPRATADFGRGPRPTIGIGWGDVATAWRSTHIPDIEVYFQAKPPLPLVAGLPKPVVRLLSGERVQRFLKRQIEKRLPPGPTPEQRERGVAILVAEAWDAQGNHVVSRLLTPEAYKLTAVTAVEAARRAADGQALAGYQTPSTAYGADFVTEVDGVTRMDL